MKTKKEHRILRRFLVYAAIIACADALVYVLFYLFAGNAAAVFSDVAFYLGVAACTGAFVAFFLAVSKPDTGKRAARDADIENTDWMRRRRMRRMREFKVTRFDSLKKREDGIVIGAEKKRNGVEIWETSELHALIVGATGSGKSSGFVDQNIAALAESATKPVLVISDPKKELYKRHARSLKARGYRVSAIDLRDPYRSKRWNPMSVLTRRIKILREIENNLEFKDGIYRAGGERFATHMEARARRQELYDEIYENAADLVYTLCPVRNREQPSWEEGARNLILGFVLAMCEDCVAGKVDMRQMVLFNIYHNVTKYCTDDPEELRAYLLEGRGEFSKVRGLVNTVLITSDRTLTSYLSEVNAYMQQLSDDGILALTAENEVDALNLDERPNAVFVIVPDERETRHRFVTLFVTQLYKEMVEKANLNLKRGKTEEATLKRRAYFILDEFGNLPRFDSIDQMVTVGRSRGIRFLFVLQSFSQLSLKYGKERADVVKSNCNVKIFIGSDDEATRREFSDLCGQKAIKSVSVSSSSGGASSTSSVSSRPLVTPGMLERLNGEKKGDAVVSVRGYDPILAHFTPSYKLKKVYFPEGDDKGEARKPIVFDKKEYLFDIAGDERAREIEAAMEKIEKMENEAPTLEENAEELDSRWREMESRARDEIEFLCVYLDPDEQTVLRNAPLNMLTRILHAMEVGDQSASKKEEREKIRATIGNLERIFRDMKEVQERARYLRG